MADVVWTDPALSDLDAIADYIALDNVDAARRLVQRVFDHVGQLGAHPHSGPRPPELKGRRYRQIVEPPCRVFYRVDGGACTLCTSCGPSDGCARRASGRRAVRRRNVAARIKQGMALTRLVQRSSAIGKRQSDCRCASCADVD